MKKFKLIKQVGFYHSSEKNIPQTEDIIVECDEIKYIRDEIKITEENISKAKIINEEYNVGDTLIGVLGEVSFIKDDLEINNVKVLADPYYKLYEFKNDKWNLIDKHTCKKHR